MSNNNRNTAKAGTGFCGLLTIAFIVLKLVGVIDWKWGWVLSPLWIGAILAILVIAFYVFVVWKLINL